MFAEQFANVRAKSPLIHNITNYVTVNDCANMVLALVGIGSGLINGNLEDAMNGVFTSLGNIFPNAP